MYTATQSMSTATNHTVPHDIHHTTRQYVDRYCGRCYKAAAARCTKCQSVYYCSKECQAKDWTVGGHKVRCKQLRIQNEQKLPSSSSSSSSSTSGNCRNTNGIHTSASSQQTQSQTTMNRVRSTVTDAVKHVVKSAAKSAVGKLKNGMMEDDDYFRNGIPPSPYTLDTLPQPYQHITQNQQYITSSLSLANNNHRHLDAQTTTTTITTTQHITTTDATVTPTPATSSSLPLHSRHMEHHQTTTSTSPSTSITSTLLAENAITLESIFSHHRHIDPYDLAGDDIADVTDSITSELIGTDHPVLRKVANYFFNVSGKRVRPAIIFLLSRAVNAGMDTPYNIAHNIAYGGNIHSVNGLNGVIDILPTQRRISEITEMIHTASLLHDDVIDGSTTRRGVPTVNSVFGNKLAILGGDFLLARSSLAMGRLRNDAVTESVSTVIEHLVKGEIMQLKPDYNLSCIENHDELQSSFHTNLQIYLTKSFYKTASLIAYASKAVATLSGQPEDVQNIAFEYGKQIGLAFQIVDDVLDIVGNSHTMGKAASGADLTSGVLTLPLLYAAEECAELRPILDGKSKIKDPEQVRRALYLTIHHSNGIARSQELAQKCIESAVASILHLKPTQYQSALIRLAELVLTRQK